MTNKHCPNCGSEISAKAPGELCPACLLRGAEDSGPQSEGAPSLAEIATAFPNLEILKLLGQGGMGYVYRVRQPELDRVAALKILSPALGSDPAFAERFSREARVLGKLQHPNIVNIYESGEQGGYFYFIMEHVDGVNLRQAMAAGRFTPEQALAVVPGICDALQAAHSEGIWHRDIKPENILLDRDGTVKIVDFGIARLVSDPQRNFTLTMAGQALGSSAYMAPEQHEQPHNVDHRADIYSLGVVIYELLTGELPLGRFPSPGERSEVNARIDEIVLKTLEKERELRHQNVAEVKTDFETASTKGLSSPKASPKVPGNGLSSEHFQFLTTPLGLWLGGVAVGTVGAFSSPLIFGIGGIVALVGLAFCGIMLWKLAVGRDSPEDRVMPTSLALWVGGVALAAAGSDSSLLLIVLGYSSAILGLLGSGIILWKVRRKTRPIQERLPLLVLVFWPTVFVLALLSIAGMQALHELFASRRSSYWFTDVGPIALALSAIAVPLLIGHFLWLGFGAQSASVPRHSASRGVIALVIALGSIAFVVYLGKRTQEAQSHYARYFQVTCSDNEWGRDRAPIEEATEEAAGLLSPVVFAPHDSRLPSRYVDNQYPWVRIEWRSPTPEKARETQDALAENLRLALPKRFRVNPSFLPDVSDSDSLANHHQQFSALLVFIPILGVFVVLVLLVPNGWKGIAGVSILTLIFGAAIGKAGWPAPGAGLPPLISAENPLPVVTIREFDYSTKEDAIASHIKAAMGENQAVFEVALSTRLMTLVSPYPQEEIRAVMVKWQKLSFVRVVSKGNQSARVKLQNKATKETHLVHLKQWNGNWQIDSLYPIPENESPSSSFQQLIQAAKDEEPLALLDGIATPLLAELEREKPEDSPRLVLDSSTAFLAGFYDVSAKSIDGDKAILEARHAGFEKLIAPDQLHRCHLVREFGKWRFTGEFEAIERP